MLDARNVKIKTFSAKIKNFCKRAILAEFREIHPEAVICQEIAFEDSLRNFGFFELFKAKCLAIFGVLGAIDKQVFDMVT